MSNYGKFKKYKLYKSGKLWVTGAIAVVAKYVQNPIFGDKHIDWVTIINEVTGLETEIPIQKVVEILMIGSFNSME
ncbi:hypothetical protein LCIT_08550 [Leuconostoc citreum]|uniref:Uncharacterized protein n=1 Tax=Leuconostoc citreum TaxID=33964 RepID=A0A5A5U195_LEUCI|nr:KxYKxGKxW signal peptide domain-containing protein [Leuconostoc citreum]GDZ83613.1 hypothetical protein LCIT_08550 [Leuconostoc citreum]